MASILVNASALTALQSLRITQNTLNKTQQQVSTGLKISTAADNASTWAIAETMKSDKGVLASISDSLSGADATLTVAASAMKSVLGTMNDIKTALADASRQDADLNKIGANIEQLSKQLISNIQSATFNGINLLDGSLQAATGSATLSFVASYQDSRGATNTASTLGTIDLPTQQLYDSSATPGTTYLQGVKYNGTATATDFTAFTQAGFSSSTKAQITEMMSNADKSLSDLQTYAAQIGATQTRVQRQSDFIKTISDALTTGISALVDADMNEVSTRLQALQTQQQLGVQSLSIANQNAQIILKLFQ